MILNWFRTTSYHDQFEKIVKYELCAVGFVLATNILSSVLSFLIIIATSYLLYLLWKIEKRGWFYFLMIPSCLLLVIAQFPFQNHIVAYIITVAPLVFLFICLWLLLITSRQWKKDHQFAQGKDVFQSKGKLNHPILLKDEYILHQNPGSLLHPFQLLHRQH